MELARTDGIDLSILDTDQELDGELAWNVAYEISYDELDTDAKKGKFWNICKHGTRKKICDHFGWSYHSMQKYGAFVREISHIRTNVRISFNHWRVLEKLKITRDGRGEWFQRVADNEWSPKQLTNNVKEAIKDETEVPIVETDEFQENLENSLNGETEDTGSSSSASTAVRATKKISVGEAKKMFGINPLTQDTIDVLYKHLSKKYHPDKGGSAEAFSMLGKCKERLEKTL